MDYIEKILSLDEAADLIQGIVDMAKEVNLGIIVVHHGDLMVSSQSFEYIYKRDSGVAGFISFATIERFICSEGNHRHHQTVQRCEKVSTSLTCSSSLTLNVFKSKVNYLIGAISERAVI